MGVRPDGCKLMPMRKTLRILLLAAVVVIGLTPLLMADPVYNGYSRRYYVEPTHQTLRGVHMQECDGSHWFWGTLSGYLVEEMWLC
jgi:hypothetical protein